MSAIDDALRKRPTSGAVSISELWRGTVAEVFTDGSAQVIVPHLGGAEPIGRIESLVPNLAVGARVIVGAIEGRRDDLVVLSALGTDGTVVTSGRFTAVSIDLAPTLPEHAARKDYVDAGLSGKAASSHTHALVDGTGRLNFSQLPAFPEIPNLADLNAYDYDGIFHQSQNVEAAAGANYPAALAGLLEVRVSGSFVYQRYTLYNSGKVYTRSRYISTWYAWREVTSKAELDAGLGTKANAAHTHAAADTTSGTFDPARLPAATGSAAGSLSAADKAKLDAATHLATGDTLALRHASGAVHVVTGTGSSDAASKGYVDGETAKRALASHAHLWADLTDKPSTFAPSAHSHAATDITGSTTTGRAVLAAADAAAARTAIGAGTSSLVVGTGSTNAMAGNKTFNYSEIIGTVPTAALPPLAVIETYTPANQAAMLALTAQRGDLAIRLDTSKTYVLSSDSPGTLADWKELLAAGQVTSVAGKSGVVSLVKADVGLSSVDNTSDAAKPVSTATQTALNGKANTAHTHAAEDLTGGTATIGRIRLTDQTDASATSTGHAFQIGPDTGTNLIIDNNEIIARQNGVVVSTYFEGGVHTGTQQTSGSALTRKDYVDAQDALQLTIADHPATFQNAFIIGEKSPTDLATTYPVGVSMFPVSTATGWPITYGVVTTYRVATHRSYQTFTQKNSGRQWQRAEDNNGVWGAVGWYEVASTSYVDAAVLTHRAEFACASVSSAPGAGAYMGKATADTDPLKTANNDFCSPIATGPNYGLLFSRTGEYSVKAFYKPAASPGNVTLSLFVGGVRIDSTSGGTYGDWEKSVGDPHVVIKSGEKLEVISANSSGVAHTGRISVKRIG